MFAIRFSLPSLALLLSPAVLMAQAASTRVIEKTSETTRTAAADEFQSMFQPLGWELATADEGVRIERIAKNSPVAEAHLEEKDIIRKVAGENVLTAARIAEIIAGLRSDGESQTDVVVLRDGEELSYLLPLDAINAAGSVTTSRSSTRVIEADLVQMIQQLQLEAEQQRTLLETLLTEVQSLRLQLGSVPQPQVGAAPAGTVVTPVAPVPVTTPGRRSGAPGVPRTKPR